MGDPEGWIFPDEASTDIMLPDSGPYKFLLTDYDYGGAITEIEQKL